MNVSEVIKELRNGAADESPACRALIDKAAGALVSLAAELEEAKQKCAALAPLTRARWQGEADGYADGYPVYDVWYCSECEHCIDDGTDDPAFLPCYCPN